MDNPVIKVTFAELAKINPMLIEKLSKTPTTVTRASHLREIVQQVSNQKALVHERYQDIAKKFGKVDEKGKFETAENAFGFSLKEGVTDAQVVEAIEEFDKNTVEIKGRPLTPDTLNDIRFSAVEIEQLGSLYTNVNGPGLPHLNAVR